MVKNKRHLAVNDDTFELVTKRCKEEFYTQNPKMKGVRISNDYIIRRIALYYLDEELEDY